MCTASALDEMKIIFIVSHEPTSVNVCDARFHYIHLDLT